MIDLVIPTVTGREQSFRRCIRSFIDHTHHHVLRFIEIHDEPTCGEAWIKGLERSRAPYVGLLCDDQECISDKWAEVCIETVEEGLLPCPRVYTPEGAVESQGGDLNAYGHLRAYYRKDRAPCNFTTVPFMSREQAQKIGMLPVHYASDVWVSYRGRQLGYETVLRHGFDLIHHQEQVARGAGMAQHERDAIDNATVLKELEKCES